MPGHGRPATALQYPGQPSTGEYTKRILTVPVAHADGRAHMLAVLVYEALPAAVQGTPVLNTSDWLAWYQTHKAPLQNRK